MVENLFETNPTFTDGVLTRVVLGFSFRWFAVSLRPPFFMTAMHTAKGYAPQGWSKY